MGGADVQVSSGFTSSSIWLSYPNERGIALDTVSSEIRFVPTPDPFGGIGIADPVSSSGWEAFIGFGTSERRFVSVQLSLLEDPLGAELCPEPDSGMDPPEAFPPILMLDLTGTGAMGAFESEAYVSSCYRVTLMPPSP
jgi:hypothetical protein